MSYSVVKYSVIEGRPRQFLTLVTSLWKVLITNENHSLYMLYLWTAEKMEMDKSKGMSKCSFFTSPWQLMVWFTYEQWKRGKESFRACPMLSSHKHLYRQDMCSFQKHCASKCWDSARNYAVQLLVCGKCCICSSLHASPHADRSGRVEDAAEINLYTSAVTRCGFGGSRKLVNQ